jgi:predicted lysophospholipase L1 biosynthesis ABC-type transport system permease subunit
LALIASSLLAVPSLAAEGTSGLIQQASNLLGADLTCGNRIQTGSANGLT